MEEESLDSSCTGTTIKSTNSNNTRPKPKKVMFIRGNNSNLVTTLLMRDFSRLKKSHSVYLKEKYNIKPFEDATTIEDLAREQNCGLFMFSSHNKKRPNNLIIGRLSEEDKTIKEMVEFGVENFYSMQEIKPGAKLPANSRLCLTFDGPSFQECNDYRLFKELISEFFQGHSRDNEKLSKVDYCVKLTSEKQISKFDCYRVIPRYKSSKVCKIEYEDLGPNFNFWIRRVKLFTSEVLMDIPEEIPEPPIVVKSSDCDNIVETSTLIANPIDDNSSNNNNNNNTNNTLLRNHEQVNFKKLNLTKSPDRGIKRSQDDLDERLKRMKFVD